MNIREFLAVNKPCVSMRHSTIANRNYPYIVSFIIEPNFSVTREFIRDMQRYLRNWYTVVVEMDEKGFIEISVGVDKFDAVERLKKDIDVFVRKVGKLIQLAELTRKGETYSGGNNE